MFIIIHIPIVCLLLVCRLELNLCPPPLPACQPLCMHQRQRHNWEEGRRGDFIACIFMNLQPAADQDVPANSSSSPSSVSSSSSPCFPPLICVHCSLCYYDERYTAPLSLGRYTWLRGVYEQHEQWCAQSEVICGAAIYDSKKHEYSQCKYRGPRSSLPTHRALKHTDTQWVDMKRPGPASAHNERVLSRRDIYVGAKVDVRDE